MQAQKIKNKIDASAHSESSEIMASSNTSEHLVQLEVDIVQQSSSSHGTLLTNETWQLVREITHHLHFSAPQAKDNSD